MKRIFAVLLFLLPAAAWGQMVSNAPPGCVLNATGCSVSGTMAATAMTGDASGADVTATGATTAQTQAALAAEQGVPIEQFHQSGDADYTAAFQRAMTACVPIKLGAGTYVVNNFSTGTSCANFVLTGVPGESIIQRTGASGSQFFDVQSANVYIRGVTFDMNKASVTANQWGVFFGQGGQNVTVLDSAFENNSGSLGSCLSLRSTGPAAGGSFLLQHNVFTGCSTLASLDIGSVSNGQILDNRIYGNTNVGMFIGSNNTPSSTNYSTNIRVAGNSFYDNATGAGVGGISSPYVYGTPQATYVTIAGNNFWDNSGYELGIQGDYITTTDNQIGQSAPTVTVFGGIDSNSRWSVIGHNNIVLTSSSFGIDNGGSVGSKIDNNAVTMNTTGVAINSGACQNCVVSSNKITINGSASGLVNYSVETDGAGNPFPSLSSNTQYLDNTVDMTGTSAIGLQLLDDPGEPAQGLLPIIVENNHFSVSGSGTSPTQDIVWKGSPNSAWFAGNTHNGSALEQVGINGSNDLVVDNVFLGQSFQEAGTISTVRSIVPYVQAAYEGKIAYAYMSSEGSGYTSATTVSASCASSGASNWVGQPLINQGHLVGIRTTTIGTGCVGAATITITDTGGGTGAVAVAGTTYGPPDGTNLTYISAGAAHPLQNGGGYMSLLPAVPLEMSSNALQLKSGNSGAYWRIIGGQSVPPFAVGGLPTCSSLNNGAQILVTGSTTSKWQARCNGTNWLWPDGTTVSG